MLLRASKSPYLPTRTSNEGENGIVEVDVAIGGIIASSCVTEAERKNGPLDNPQGLNVIEFPRQLSYFGRRVLQIVQRKRLEFVQSWSFAEPKEKEPRRELS